MKRLYIDRIVSAALPLLWMVVIFWFSAQNGESSGSFSAGVTEKIVRLFMPGFDGMSPEAQANAVESVHLLVRKAAHFSEYAVLGILTVNALRTYRLSRVWRVALPVAVCFCYAVSDEIHQYFIPERACRFLDVMIDTAGAIFGVGVFMLCSWIIKRRMQKRRLKRDTQN